MAAQRGLFAVRIMVSFVCGDEFSFWFPPPRLLAKVGQILALLLFSRQSSLVTEEKEKVSQLGRINRLAALIRISFVD
jgi:hypothetical protein